MKTYVHDDSISLISSKNEKCFRKKRCRENESGHLTFQNYPLPAPPKIVPFMTECGKIWYGQTVHRRQYNTAHAHCMLDNQGYRRTLRIRNTSCFLHGKMVTRTRLNVTFIHTLPVLFQLTLTVFLIYLPPQWTLWLGYGIDDYLATAVRFPSVTSIYRFSKTSRKALGPIQVLFLAG